MYAWSRDIILSPLVFKHTHSHTHTHTHTPYLTLISKKLVAKPSVIPIVSFQYGVIEKAFNKTVKIWPVIPLRL